MTLSVDALDDTVIKPAPGLQHIFNYQTNLTSTTWSSTSSSCFHPQPVPADGKPGVQAKLPPPEVGWFFKATRTTKGSHLSGKYQLSRQANANNFSADCSFTTAAQLSGWFPQLDAVACSLAYVIESDARTTRINWHWFHQLCMCVSMTRVSFFLPSHCPRACSPAQQLLTLCLMAHFPTGKWSFH